MKQLLHSKSGGTVVRDVPAPSCRAGGVLVHNTFSAISPGTERSLVEPGRKSLVARARERPDLVKQVVDRARHEGIRATRDAVTRKLGAEVPSGYSSCGLVIEVGSGVRGLAPGDVVACAGADHAHHAEVISVPRNLCAKVPDGVSQQAAALTTIAAIALHAVRLADVRLGERVAVIGCGLVGQVTCRLLRCAGAEAFALDVDANRVQEALRGGADHALEVGDATTKEIGALTDQIGVDHAIVTAAADVSDPLRLGAEIARERGTLTLVGAVPIDLPRGPLYTKELRFRVSRSYGPGRYDDEYEERGLDYPIGYVRWTEQRNMEAVLDLQARGRLDLDDLIGEVVPVGDAAAVYDRLVGPAADRPVGAVLLSYPEDDEPRATALVAPDVGGRQAPSRATTAQRPAIGLVGPGGFATQVLVPALVAAGARLEVVGGGGGPSAEAAVRQLGFARWAESEDAVIDDPAVDAVVIATRHDSHAGLARRALAAGKHVFCEKPIALTVAELESVVDEARRSAGILAVGFNRRFSPLLVALREFVAESSGAITAAYRVSAGALPPGDWVHDLDQGGGRIVGEVCHFIDSLSFVAGSEVTEVHAAGHGSSGAPLQARDNVVISLAFGNGSVGTVMYVAESAAGVHKERLEAFGRGRIAVLDDYRSLELHEGDDCRRMREKSAQKGHREEMQAFLDGVRSGVAPVPLAAICNVTLATLAVVDSMRTGRAVGTEVEPP